MPLPLLSKWIESRRLKRIEKHTLAFAAIGWTIQLPVFARLLPPSEVARLRRNGEEIMAKLDYADLARPDTTILFYSRVRRFNFLACSITPVAGQSDFDKYHYDRRCKEGMLKLMQSRMPHMNMNSYLTEEQIGGRPFEDFQILMRIGDKVLFRVHVFSGEIAGQRVEISLVCRDERISDSFITSLKGSVFSK